MQKLWQGEEKTKREIEREKDRDKEYGKNWINLFDWFYQ
jgi:hypothetical protein